MKAMIVFCVLVTVAVASYYYNDAEKNNTALMEDSVENTMSSSKQVSDETGEQTEKNSYQSEYPL